MALDMDNAKYARGSVGEKNAFRTEVERRFRQLTNSIRGNKFTTLLTTIQNNWEGADSRKYQDIIKRMATDFETHVKNCQNDVLGALDDDSTKFSMLQEKNASNIEKPNIW